MSDEITPLALTAADALDALADNIHGRATPCVEALLALSVACFERWGPASRSGVTAKDNAAAVLRRDVGGDPASWVRRVRNRANDWREWATAEDRSAVWPG